MLSLRLLIASSTLLMLACTPDPAATLTGAPDSEPQPVVDMRILSADDMAGRETGTEGNARARAYIIQRFEEIGLAPVGDSFEHPFTFTRPVNRREPQGEQQTYEAVNVVGRIAGADSSQTIVISAHYDHLGLGDGAIFNGADDNASGVAGILAVASHFMAEPPQHDILIIAFDAEEMGLQGARHLVASPPAGIGEIAFNLNLDMIAYSADNDFYAVGAYHYPALGPLIEQVAEGLPIILASGYDQPSDDPRNDWTMLSDQGAFIAAGIPAMYLGVEDHEYYHTVNDEFEVMTLDFFLGAVEASVKMAEAVDANLAEIIAAPARAGETKAP